MSDGTSRMSIKGHKLYHMFSCSTLSEYMVMDCVKVLIKIWLIKLLRKPGHGYVEVLTEIKFFMIASMLFKI